MVNTDFEMADFESEHVQVEVSHEGVLWVNVNGKCALRAAGCTSLTVEDKRSTVSKHKSKRKQPSHETAVVRTLSNPLSRNTT